MILKNTLLSIRQSVHNKGQLKRIKSVGKNVNVFGNVNIIYPRNITIGDNCSLNHGAYINAFSPIHLGDDVTISAGAKIIATGIDYLSWANGEKKHLEHCSISIGNHVWIGANAQILAGVNITGEHVVVAAGAIVTRDIVESRCIVAGCPAKIIKRY